MRDLVGTLGSWASGTFVVLAVAYVAVLGAGFMANPTTKDPVKDPHLAIAEVLILIMAPVMLTLSAAIHYSVPPELQPYTLISMGWMVAAVATTSIVHLVELVVARRLRAEDFPAHERIFGFRWPSMLYAVDIAAWDVFFALAVLFAVPAFEGHGTVQLGLVVAGVLSLAGLIGPAIGNIAWRSIGIFGYAVVFPATCIPLNSYFSQLQ